MSSHLSREEHEVLTAQLADTEAQMAKLTETLAEYSEPILYGQSKDHMKGLLEQHLANLERQRDDFRQKLGLGHG